MQGLEALAAQMGIVQPAVQPLRVGTIVRTAKYLTFGHDTKGEKYGFKIHAYATNLLEAFYFWSEGEPDNVFKGAVAEISIVTDDSLGILLGEARAAVIYREAPPETKVNTRLFMGLTFSMGYLAEPEGDMRYDPEPIVLVPRLVIARRIKPEFIR